MKHPIFALVVHRLQGRFQLDEAWRCARCRGAAYPRGWRGRPASISPGWISPLSASQA